MLIFGFCPSSTVYILKKRKSSLLWNRCLSLGCNFSLHLWQRSKPKKLAIICFPFSCHDMLAIKVIHAAPFCVLLFFIPSAFLVVWIDYFCFVSFSFIALLLTVEEFRKIRKRFSFKMKRTPILFCLLRKEKKQNRYSITAPHYIDEDIRMSYKIWSYKKLDHDHPTPQNRQCNNLLKEERSDPCECSSKVSFPSAYHPFLWIMAICFNRWIGN